MRIQIQRQILFASEFCERKGKKGKEKKQIWKYDKQKQYENRYYT